MIKVIGVRFRTAGKIYFFDPAGFEVKAGDHVIVETARGVEFGTVVAGVTELEEEKVVQPLKPVIRIANAEDVEQEAANREKEQTAYSICREKIRSHGLEMKLIGAEYTFDNNKVLFYFTADGRIDFRELVKDLASVFKTRIELRQIGVRDETKMVGGIGICGRPLCCYSYLSDFVPVSIKMAKEQNLSLNPAKISGVCGRLMCCLKNEEETYEELNRRLPNIGDTVSMEDGLKGEVQSVNVLRQMVKVVVDVGDEKEIKEYAVEQLHFRRKHGKKEKMDLSREELQELERLEEEEQQEQETQESGTKKGNSQRQGGRNRQDGGQKSFGGHSEGDQKSQRRHQETGARASEQHPDGNQPASGRRSEGVKTSEQPGQRQGSRRGRQDGGEQGASGRRQDDGEQKTFGRRQDGGEQKTSGRRQDGGEQKTSGRRQDGGEQRTYEKHQNGEQKQSGKYQEGGFRHLGKNQEQGAAQAGEYPEEEQGQEAAQYPGGRNRQDSRSRPYSQRQNGGRQGGRNRYDYRGKRDTRFGQREQSNANDDQT